MSPKHEPLAQPQQANKVQSGGMRGVPLSHPAGPPEDDGGTECNLQETDVLAAAHVSQYLWPHGAADFTEMRFLQEEHVRA